MNINKVLIVLVGLLVVSLQQTQCPMNCLTCANPTSCSECALGFFLVDNAFCPPCPPGCRNCTRTLGGSMPICHDCAPPAILSPAGICFLCDPSCGTC